MTLYHCVGSSDSSSRIFVGVLARLMALNVVRASRGRCGRRWPDRATATGYVRCAMESVTVPLVQRCRRPHRRVVQRRARPHGSAVPGGRRCAHRAGRHRPGRRHRAPAPHYDRAGAGPATLVAKVPAADETSRTGARLTRTYEIEASFYRDLAAGPAGAHAVLPPRRPRPGDRRLRRGAGGRRPGRAGRPDAGCPVADIAAAIDELVLLHGPRWGDATLLDIGWLHRASPEQVEGIVGLIDATPSARSASTTPSASTPTRWRSSIASCRGSPATCATGRGRGRSSTATSGPTTCCSAASGSSSSTGRPSGSDRAPPTSATCSAPA